MLEEEYSLNYNSIQNNFNLNLIKIKNNLQNILNNNKNIYLINEITHHYYNKYEITSYLTNLLIKLYFNILIQLNFNNFNYFNLKKIINWSKNKNITLRFNVENKLITFLLSLLLYLTSSFLLP